MQAVVENSHLSTITDHFLLISSKQPVHRAKANYRVRGTLQLREGSVGMLTEESTMFLLVCTGLIPGFGVILASPQARLGSGAKVKNK